MTVKIRGIDSGYLTTIAQAMESYQEEPPDAQIDLYSHNSISVRLRVIDPAFSGMEKSARHAKIWAHLEKVSEEAQSDISMIVPLAPGEEKRSMANLEFEEPSPSLIE